MKEKRRFCPLFGKCGGCDSVNWDYEDEVLEKYLRINKLFSRYTEVAPVLKAPHLTGYRCKIQAVCGSDRSQGFVTGIYRKNTHKLIPIRSCPLEDRRAAAILQTIRTMAGRYGIRSYEEDFRDGDLRHILIRTSHSRNEVMVVLVTGREDFPHKHDLVSVIHQRHPEVVSICQILNNGKTSMVIPENAEYRVLYGKGYITDTLLGLDFRISPVSFFQVNPEQTERLYRIAMNMAQLSRRDKVIDAYCGTGTISLIAADSGAGHVIGIEANEEAVMNAEANARDNGIENAHFIAADASKQLKKMAKEGERCDVLFLDPPRSGATEEFLAAAGRMAPDRIVYISCNPDTLARDLRYIVHFLPYRVIGVQPVDLFPGTMHVETCVLLVRERYTDAEKVSVKVDMDGVKFKQEKYLAPEKATYPNIKKWVMDNYGLSVSSLYIAQVKDKLGLEKRKNYNLGSGEGRVPNCPPEKEEAIKEALKHFNMI
ncbi:MAG: 23S rRNA (uracil(1939)-C(5))-methyltransferase RlmD [Candidatus Ornithospirochaeta sp.]|nr:23S rRNA (uracil(1939)-C(5))-methyltransferase RlmD [Candidatus Ornithospirochaeta sp.]